MSDHKPRRLTPEQIAENRERGLAAFARAGVTEGYFGVPDPNEVAALRDRMAAALVDAASAHQLDGGTVTMEILITALLNSSIVVIEAAARHQGLSEDLVAAAILTFGRNAPMATDFYVRARQEQGAAEEESP